MNIREKIKQYVDTYVIGEEQYKKKLIEDINNQEEVLIIDIKNSYKGKYEVYDNNRKLKYTVKGKTISSKPCLHIYNTWQRQVATIQQNKRSFRLYEVHDLIFNIENKKMSVFKNKSTLLKNRYNLDNGWNIERKVLKQKYEIKNLDKIIAKISPCGLEEIIIFSKNENELLILMVVLAISMYDIINERYCQKEARKGGGG